MKGPVAIRYPRGGDEAFTEVAETPILRSGDDITLCGYGITVNALCEAADLLHQQGIEAEIVKLNRIFPPEPAWEASARKTGVFLMVEECPAHGGIFDLLAASPAMTGVRRRELNLGQGFISHGGCSELRRRAGIDPQSIFEAASALKKGGCV